MALSIHEEDKLKERIQKLWITVNVTGPDSPLEASRVLYGRYMASGREAEAYATHSSNLYSAAATHRALASSAGIFGRIFHYAKTFCLLMEARLLSDRLEAVSGLSKMSPAELDVRATILRRTRAFAKAKRCLEEALVRDYVTDETRVLLTLGLIELVDRTDFGEGEKLLRELERSGIMREVRIETQVRAYRAFARHFGLTQGRNEARKYICDAIRLAEEYGLANQLAKARAERDRIFAKLGKG